jgi:hypothetical protein
MAQTNFLGRMRLAFTDADVHMSLWEDFLVVPANVFNSLVTGTNVLDVDLASIEAKIDIIDTNIDALTPDMESHTHYPNL